MDKSLIYEAEHDNLLKNLEKNLEIPPECTYADQKAVGAEVSAPSEMVLQETVSLSSHCSPAVDSDEQNN